MPPSTSASNSITKLLHTVCSSSLKNFKSKFLKEPKQLAIQNEKIVVLQNSFEGYHTAMAQYGT